MLEVVRVASMIRGHWDTLVVDKLSVGVPSVVPVVIVRRHVGRQL